MVERTVPPEPSVMLLLLLGDEALLELGDDDFDVEFFE